MTKYCNNANIAQELARVKKNNLKTYYKNLQK